MRSRVALAAMLLTAAGTAAVAGTAEEALQAARDRYPTVDVRSAEATPLPGVFKYDMGGETVYGDAGARYLILGKLVDMDANPAPQPGYAEVAGRSFLLQDGDRGELVVFSDPDCPYCAMLERRLVAGELSGWRIGVVLIRSTGGTGEVAARILCSADPGRAYRSYLLEGREPDSCEGGDAAAHEEVAARLGVTATPTFMVPSGALVAGLPEASELRDWAERGQPVR